MTGRALVLGLGLCVVTSTAPCGGGRHAVVVDVSGSLRWPGLESQCESLAVWSSPWDAEITTGDAHSGAWATWEGDEETPRPLAEALVDSLRDSDVVVVPHHEQLASIVSISALLLAPGGKLWIPPLPAGSGLLSSVGSLRPSGRGESGEASEGQAGAAFGRALEAFEACNDHGSHASLGLPPSLTCWCRRTMKARRVIR